MPEWLLVLSLIILGFIFLLVELLIIPGFGFMGVLGLLCLAGGCYIAWTELSLAVGIATLIGSLLIIVLFLRLFPKSIMWKKLRLESKMSKGGGFQAGTKELEELIDKKGLSITPLRPSGTALIMGRRVDVVTEGVFLQKDTPIKVVKVEGNKVIVRGI